MKTILFVTIYIILLSVMGACRQTNKSNAFENKDTLIAECDSLIGQEEMQPIKTNAIQVFKIGEDKKLQVLMPIDSFYRCGSIDSIQLIKNYKVPYFTEADYQIEVYSDIRYDEVPRIVIKRGKEELVSMLNGCDFVNWERVDGMESKEYVQYVPLSEDMVLAFFTTLRDGTCEPAPGNVVIVALTYNDAKLVFCEPLEFDKFDVTPEHFRLTLNKGCGEEPYYTLWQEGDVLMFRQEEDSI